MCGDDVRHSLDTGYVGQRPGETVECRVCAEAVPAKAPGTTHNYWVMFHGHGHLSLSGHLVNQELLVNAIKTNCDDLEIITR